MPATPVEVAESVVEALRTIIREHDRFLTSADDARGRAFSKCTNKARAALAPARALVEVVRALEEAESWIVHSGAPHPGGVLGHINRARDALTAAQQKDA